MSAPVKRATIADLYECEGKAELIDGRIVESMTSGLGPNESRGKHLRVAPRIRTTDARAGRAFTDGMGFTVPILSSGQGILRPLMPRSIPAHSFLTRSGS